MPKLIFFSSFKDIHTGVLHTYIIMNALLLPPSLSLSRARVHARTEYKPENSRRTLDIYVTRFWLKIDKPEVPL